MNRKHSYQSSEAESPAVTTLSLYQKDGDTMSFVGIPFGITPSEAMELLGDEKGTFHLFTTTVTVERQALDAEYIFTQTLGNQGRETECLSELYVYPPSDAKLEDWLAPISKTWSDYQSTDGTSWASYYTLGMVLDQQQKDVIQPQIDASQMTGTLDEWCLSAYFHRTDKGAWVFNGTGIALYTAAQEIR